VTDKIERLLRRLVSQGLQEAEDTIGVRVRRQQDELAGAIRDSLDEQEEEEEEAEAEEETEEEGEPGEEAGEEAGEEVEAGEEGEEPPPPPEPEAAAEEKPKAKRKMSPPKIARGTKFSDFKHNFNIIRSAKALSRTIDGSRVKTKSGKRLENYYGELESSEQQALQKFMVGIAQVLLLGKPGDEAMQPDSPPNPVDTVGTAPGATEEETVSVSIKSDMSEPPIRVVGSTTEARRRRIRKILGR